MNNYKCYFVTCLGTEKFGREILEMIVVQASNLFNASLKAHEIVDNNPDRYLFLHEIYEEC